VFVPVFIATQLVDIALGLEGKFHFAISDVLLDLGAATLLGLFAHSVLSYKSKPARPALKIALVLGLIVGGVVLVLMIQGGEASQMLLAPFSIPLQQTHFEK